MNTTFTNPFSDAQLYDWRTFFRELCQKIASYSSDDLREKVSELFEGEAPILNYPNIGIDPFSVVYTIASKGPASGKESRPSGEKLEFYQKMKRVFELTPDPASIQDWIFPIPPSVNTLFHTKGSRADGTPEKEAEALKTLRDCFGAIVAEKKSDALDPTRHADLFGRTLAIKGCGVPSLTQVMFLANPDRFLPIDEGILSLPIPKSGTLNDAKKKMNNDKGLGAYFDLIKTIQRSFPGCDNCEINYFAYLISSGQLKISKKYFQVSTNVYNRNEDHVEEFRGQSGVWTGGPGNYPLREPKRGDVMLIRRGGEGRGIGVVLDNQYADNVWNEKSVIRIVWIHAEKGDLAGQPQQFGFNDVNEGHQTFRAFRNSETYKPTFALLDSIRKGNTQAENDTQTATTVREDATKNVILYGPPGTGKTHLCNKLIQLVEEHKSMPAAIEALSKEQTDPWDGQESDGVEDGRVRFLTFHQSYSYEDFIEGFRPVSNGGGDSEASGSPRIRLEPGVFKKFCEDAEEQRDRRFYLIIDEINRGNISKIFGELITLLEEDKRGKSVTLPYSGDTFSIPPNIYVIATMNSTDKSIALVDVALRRRFTFVRFDPRPELVTDADARKLMKALNEEIEEKIDKDHQIGHSYFMKVPDDYDLEFLKRYKLQPLIEEYTYANLELYEELSGLLKSIE